MKASMKDRVRERIKNQGVAFSRKVAEVQLKRARVKLSADWSRQRPEKRSSDDEESASPPGCHVVGP